MSEQQLTKVETATLLILMAEAKPVPNAKLTNEYRCELKKPSREKLERLKLIEVESPSGRFVLTLVEEGWARCRLELDSGVMPPGSGAVGGALYAVLWRLGQFLAVQDLSLADFVAASDPLGGADKSAKVTELDVEERIHAAYRAIARRDGDLVSLADIRDQIEDLAAADVNAALLRLNRRRGVVLVPEANQKTLDARLRAAAVVIGDQAKHAISMGAS